MVKSVKSVVVGKSKTKKIVLMYKNLKKHKDIFKKLDSKEIETIKNYKSYGFVEINNYLYSDKKIENIKINSKFLDRVRQYFSDNTKNLVDIRTINASNIKKYVELYVNKEIIDKINMLDRILQKKDILKLDGKEVLYHGTEGYTTIKKKNKVGDVIIFKKFLSTTTEQSVSERFMDKTCCLYRFMNMKNVPYLYVPWNLQQSHDLSKKIITEALDDEFEYLLPRGLKFRIVKIEYVNFKVNKYDAFKKLSFAKFAKLYNTKLDNLDKLHNNITNKILVYNLEYVGQEPLELLEPFVYYPNIKLNLYTTSNDKKVQEIFNFVDMVKSSKEKIDYSGFNSII